LYIESVDNVATFYIDAAQFESIPSGQIALPTTYIDGDQTSLTTDNSEVVYYWNGTPHASTSVRLSGDRSGGRELPLSEMGVVVNAISGLGLSTPNNISLPFSQLDGEQYQRTQKEPRVFSLGGRITGSSQAQLDRLFGSLTRVVDTDVAPFRQPLVLRYVPVDEDENQIGSEVSIPCIYQGGMEGQRNNHNTEQFVASFSQLYPVLLGHEEGETLNVYDEIAATNFLIKRSPGGLWSALSTGISGGTTTINAIAEHPNGTIYIGGNFTDAGGSGADYAAIYNPITDTFSVVKAATAFNAEVFAIVIDQASGHVYFGGAFTNVDGIAAADGIVDYDVINNTFAALGSGVSAGTSVLSLALDGAGFLFAGGTFLLMNGVANTVRFARWNINTGVWQAFGTGVNGDVNTILALASGIVYIGGDFLLAGGVASTIRIAKWNGAAWTAMGTGANARVRDLLIAPSGILFIAGSFTTINGLSIQYLAKWNGTGFSALDSGTSVTNAVYSLSMDPTGMLYLVGAFLNINGVVYDVSAAKFDNGAFTPLDMYTFSAATKILVSRNGSIYIGLTLGSGAAIPGSTVVTNHGSAYAYPIMTITCASPSQDIQQLINVTTKKAIYLDYTMQIGEIAVFNFNPQKGSFTSNLQGNLASKVLPGSNEGSFYLVPGDNTIRILATNAFTVAIRWSMSFLSASDPVGVI
jgi:hypothetical protein